MVARDDARDNRLLESMPVREFKQIQPALERVSLTAGEILHEAGFEIEYVYFPTTALITLLFMTQSGATVGVGMIGSEGLLGIELFTGGASAPSLAMVQNAGIAYRMKAADFRAKCVTATVCRDSLIKYMHALIAQVSQTAVCNRFHSVPQRYARWLLESSDHLEASRLAITHQQIASALGVRRESITLAARNLSSAGILKVERGGVTILDRQALEFAACECYKVVAAEYNSLLGRGMPQTSVKNAERRVRSSL